MDDSAQGKGGGGAWGAARDKAATLLAIGQTRLELLGNEIEVGRIVGLEAEEEGTLRPFEWHGRLAMDEIEQGGEVDRRAPVPFHQAAQQGLNDFRRMKLRHFIQPH